MATDPALKRLNSLLKRIEPYLPETVPPLKWTKAEAARWQSHYMGGHLEAIATDTRLSLDDILGVDTQKQKLDANTRQFLHGLPANNALLWGSRGTGKSSLIRALLNSYADEGLRMIEVDKTDLRYLPRIVQQIHDKPFRFILYCDDLSFDDHDESYKALKSALDGSLFVAPDNILIYATSNRRHLMPEYQNENEAVKHIANEIHHGESVEEKISLSDRFGLWLSFYANDQNQYLAVCRHWLARLAQQYDLNLEWNEETQLLALRWALNRGNRSGRSAWQFARHWVGKALLEAGHQTGKG